MTAENLQRRVLVVGRSQLVLNDTIANLRDLGYRAHATNNFYSDITARFDPNELDLVIFGGQVPADRKTELREEIAAINPQVVFVQGLAGIPGLIVNQIQGAFTAAQRDLTQTASYAPDERTIRVTLAEPDEVKVTVWWTTSTVPPAPKSDSLVLLDGHLPPGNHTIQIPADILPKRAFATVQIKSAIYPFSLATAD